MRSMPTQEDNCEYFMCLEPAVVMSNDLHGIYSATHALHHVHLATMRESPVSLGTLPPKTLPQEALLDIWKSGSPLWKAMGISPKLILRRLSTLKSLRTTRASPDISILRNDQCIP